MTQMLNTLFDFISPLWEMSLTAAFAAVVVFLLRLVLKERAPRQVVCLLWLIVFARLLIPVTLQSPMSLVPDMTDGAPAPVVSQLPQIPTPTQPVQPDPAPMATTPVEDPVAVPPVITPSAPAVSAPVIQPETPAADPAISRQAVIAAVWALGVAAMLVYGTVSYLTMRRRVRFAIRSGDGAWEDPRLRSPFILGLFRPRIYLPWGLTGCTRRFILCHEQAHLRRRDYIVKPICWLALAVHWFNPAAWAAFLLLSRDMEVACDQSVLRELGPEVKADYSATLLALATNGRFPAPTPLAFGEGDAGTRIKGVLNFKKPALWVTIVAVVVAVAAAVCLLTDPVEKFDPTDYTTSEYYPGLYFQEETDERYGHKTTKAYKLVDGEPVLVAGYTLFPANNFDFIIHPDGTVEQNWASTNDTLAIYEQYLADACLEADPDWVENHFVQTSVFHSTGGVAAMSLCYTPHSNLLLYRDGTVQILPLSSFLTKADLTYGSLTDLDGDGVEELVLLWNDLVKSFAADEPDTILSIGDSLMVCDWDGDRWTAHYSTTKAIPFCDKPITFDAEAGTVTVEYDHPQNFPGPGYEEFTIPAHLGKVEDIVVSKTGQIQLTDDGAFALCYTVFALPEGGTESHMEPLFYLDALLTYNGEDFDVVFTGVSNVYSIDVPQTPSPVSSFVVTPLMDNDNGDHYTRFQLTYNSASTIFEGKATNNEMRAVDGTYTTDLNDDGVQELIIALTVGYGTGFLEQELHVFDSITLEEYPADGLVDDLESRFTFTSDEDNFYVSAENFSAAISKEEIGYDDLMDKIYIGDVFRFVEEDGKLYCVFGCCVGNIAVYYGELWTELTLVDGKLTPAGYELRGVEGTQPELPTELVTDETYPGPEDYYLVGKLPEEDIWLYARNNKEVMLVWGNYSWNIERRSHTIGLDLPQLTMLDDNTLAVISYVSSGQNTGVSELTVYQLVEESQVGSSYYTGMRDYVYDWSAEPLLQDFNRNNALTYDADDNSFSMTWNGITYDTGPMVGGFAEAINLKDGATGAANANGQHVLYQINEDGTITVTVRTILEPDSKTDGIDYSHSIGSVGFDPTWTIRFNGSGFELVEGSFHFP